MQPQVITLDVDVDNTGANNVDVEYRHFGTEGNKSTYFTASHTPGSREMLSLYRSMPTRSGNFKGVVKSSVKFTRDIVVTGVDGNNITSPMIVDISFSPPFGVAADDAMKLRQTGIALLDIDAVMDALNIQGMI